MHRYCTRVLIALCATGLIWIAPARADDSTDIQAEIDKLESELDVLAREEAQDVGAAVEDYLDRNEGFHGAQGDDAWSKFSLGAHFLAVNQNTLTYDPINRAVVNGRVELDLSFQVTDSLGIFANLLAQTDGSFPGSFPPDSGGFTGARTFAGQDDGIGVNGSLLPRPLGGVQVREAGLRYFAEYTRLTVGMEVGLIDPRERYLQNRFMGNERTQFINNEFDDASAFSWATTADATPDILGFHFWFPLGNEEQFTLRVGYFNEAGRFFDNGQLYLEFQWSFEVSGNEMNLVFTFMRDSYTGQAAGEDDNQFGVSWDWQFSDRLGFFARFATNTEDVASVESGLSAGAVWSGVGDRADDEIGAAFYYLKANENVLVGLLEDTEIAFEVYYKYMAADGKLQISPHIIYVTDPGGGGLAWEDDSLFIFGIRFYVPF